MRKGIFAAPALILFAVMTGCRHRSAMIVIPPAPPPQAKQKVVVPEATMADMPELPASTSPTVVLGGEVAPTPPKSDSQSDRNSQPATDNAGNKSAASQNSAAGEELPNTTPIGSLSAAPNTHGLPSGANIAKEISWIQGQLHGIRRVLNPKEQHTASQIRTFLAKAQNALQAGDLDGANNLTTKARVLLGEIQ